MIHQVENPALEVHDLTVTYHRKPVLWNIDLTAPKGKLIGIVGPNGAGKSTLIKACMGLLPIASGHAEIFGKSLDEVRQQVSYVPQRESVDWDFPASVYDVVAMGRYGVRGLFRRLRQADKDIIERSIKKVGLESFKNRQISQLSGGQQQRVFLARALAQEADLYFMDEPFAGVDAATERAILSLLQEMSSAGKTVIVVHHDLQTVENFFDWVILLNLRLVASGPVKEVFTPELLQQTYGGRLTVLSEVTNLMRQKEIPTRKG
jgi:manganese/zinc/iron transport system ATP- binding protein